MPVAHRPQSHPSGFLLGGHGQVAPAAPTLRSAPQAAWLHVSLLCTCSSGAPSICSSLPWTSVPWNTGPHQSDPPRWWWLLHGSFRSKPAPLPFHLHFFSSRKHLSIYNFVFSLEWTFQVLAQWGPLPSGAVSPGGWASPAHQPMPRVKLRPAPRCTPWMHWTKTRIWKQISSGSVKLKTQLKFVMEKEWNTATSPSNNSNIN